MIIITIIIIIRRRRNLELEIQRVWQMKTEVIPVVVGALGTIKKGGEENIKRVSYRANETYRDPKNQHAAICKNPQEGA